jgi:CarD family transcriptional regulator
MFRLNDKVVYPGHGVAKVIRIVDKEVAGQLASFYELRFLNKEMTVLVPIANAEGIGLRPLSSSNSIDGIFKLLAEPAKKLKNYELSANNWNKRNKEYQLKLRTGSLEEISEIYRDLKHIAQQKELSFGEKNLLIQTENLLAEEISIVRKLEAEKTVEYLRSMFNTLEKTQPLKGQKVL